MYDFYKWEYDYGHDLDPTAAIKIPGMSYQPPLIGTKQLLNFTATSWPASGGWLAIVAVTLGVACVGYEYFVRSRTSRVSPAPGATLRHPGNGRVFSAYRWRP